METEAAVVNGSHEPEVEVEEKILKPRKSVLSNDNESNIVQNGNNENGTQSEENGHDVEIEIEDSSKKPRRQHVAETKKEGTPKKQTNKQIIKDATPPPKRELRPRESTPKHESKRRGTPVKVTTVGSPKKQSNDNQPNLEPVNGENLKLKDTVDDLAKEESVITIEDTDKEESIVSINDSTVNISMEEPKGFFSGFRKSFKSNSSGDVKGKCEASSSQSIIYLDSPSVTDEKYTSNANNDIKGRKPIHSFSRFPGRHVSYESIDSRKRRADNSFDDDVERKRFAGETESGSEKSPGWNFFSPGFGRVWSPTQRDKSSLPTSTPLLKKMDEDSMAVNYNEDTKLSLNASEEAQPFQEVEIPEKSRYRCTVM
uniref:Uncharacterized protein n=1 Tax=Graphocephala atropunctata TaxID=36148 RepID=A0A1B6KW69_9HEMI